MKKMKKISSPRKPAASLQKLMTFAQLMKRLPKRGSPVVYVDCLVDAKLAQALLEHRPTADDDQQRTVREKNVTRYAELMLAGQWFPNPSSAVPIRYDGKCIGGQHRLLAVVAAGTAVVPLTFALGTEAEVKYLANEGVPQTYADTLAMENTQHHKRIASLYRAIQAYETGGRIITRRGLGAVDRYALNAIRVRHTLAHEFIIHKRTPLRAKMCSTALLDFMHYATWRVDSAKSAAFITAVMEGTGLHRGHPVLALRDRLLNERNPDRDQAAAWVVKAWNFFYTGRELEIMRVAIDKVYPTIEGFSPEDCRRVNDAGSVPPIDLPLFV